MTLNLYNIFHLNLAYSAIEEADRGQVIERCYWPLLELAARHNLPFGIELSGYTLETIASSDPEWIAELRRLITDGLCELIGSGYAQLIGPLVPADVTAANLRIGHTVYERMLGIRPVVALLNEQAFSAGLVPLYQAAGYSAIIMEWNNPAREHPEWDPEWRYLPQRAKGTQDSAIDLIWNKSIGFQKFQRYAHGEIELDEMLDYVRSHLADHPRAFPVYGNDVEIFDFRPGRYMTESGIHQEGEWNRIEDLYAALLHEPGMRFIQPSAVLQLRDRPAANQTLGLSSAGQPIPVKKQEKYNILRWAVTGRDDLGINTICRRIRVNMLHNRKATEQDWKELCYLWGSDFRTHITEHRWTEYRERLDQFAKRWKNNAPATSAANVAERLATTHMDAPKAEHAQGLPDRVGRLKTRDTLEVWQHGRFLDIRGQRLQVRFNCQRGLALDGFVDLACSEHALCGTLHHGHFDDIRWAADYYSGHLILESPGRPKVTDLNAVQPQWNFIDEGLCITASLKTLMGPIEKCWIIDDVGGRLRLQLSLDWPEPILGSLRLAHLTLMDSAFDPRTLYYRTHNGGEHPETHAFAHREVNHSRPVSFLVSANQAIGMTNGVIQLGDHRHNLRVHCNLEEAAVVGLVTHQPIKNQHFTRLALSARELDDTSKPAPIGSLRLSVELSAAREKKGTD